MHTKGFTIIETLVAISVLMISIVGPLTIATKGLNSAVFAHDQVTASYLAQDAMEYIKNIRDNNLIARSSDNTTNWLNGLTICQVNARCSVETVRKLPFSSVVSESVVPCSGSTCPLYKNSEGYLTTSVNGAVISKFSRSFYLKNVSTNEATAVVEVSWNNGLINNIVTFENELFNIQK